MTDDLDDDFVKLLDDQAKALLKRLAEDANLEGEQRLTVQDQVRGFAAVSQYAQARMKLAPPEKGKSRISELAEKINEPPKPRRPRVNGHAADGGTPFGGGSSEPSAPQPPPII